MHSGKIVLAVIYSYIQNQVTATRYFVIFSQFLDISRLKSKNNRLNIKSAYGTATTPGKFKSKNINNMVNHTMATYESFLSIYSPIGSDLYSLFLEEVSLLIL